MRQVSIAIAAVLAILSHDAVADPVPFRDFQAKRVKPPAPGSVGKRITVQIDPEEQARLLAAPKPRAEPTPPDAPAEPQPVPVSRHAWFWDKVSPDLAQANPGRIDLAEQALRAAATPVSVPRLKDLQAIAQSRGRDILLSTVGTQVSPALVLAVIAVESSGRPDVESGAGAQGLMQLMPATAERFGVSDSFEPSQNIAGGVKYLDWLMGEFGADPILALAGYNAGEGAVRAHDGVPPYAETRDYVPKVLAAYQVARGLCITPPLLASDGCVFAALD